MRNLYYVKDGVAHVWLSRGKHKGVAMVDEADLPKMQGRDWYLVPRGVVTWEKGNRVLLRGIILNQRRVLHRNGDMLDCRRSNLMPEQAREQSTRTGGVQGVTFNKQRCGYLAYIRIGKLELSRFFSAKQYGGTEKALTEAKKHRAWLVEHSEHLGKNLKPWIGEEDVSLGENVVRGVCERLGLEDPKAVQAMQKVFEAGMLHGSTRTKKRAPDMENFYKRNGTLCTSYAVRTPEYAEAEE